LFILISFLPSYLLIDLLNAKEQMMSFKLSKCGLIITVLFFSSAHAQDWRKSPITSTTSDHWRGLPYTGTNSDQWRYSGLSAKYSESKLRWNKDKWQKSRSYWRNSPNRWKKDKWTKSPTYWRTSPNHWNKRKWRYSPLNWRYSELSYKNTMKKYEGGSDYRQIIKLVPMDTKEENSHITIEKKEYVKPQIETINKEIKKGSENTSSNTGYAEDYFVLINSKGSFRLDKNVQINSHMAPGGLMKIYSSPPEND
jgi:hypothetical protein